jgi:DNA invertase Pin-like site-specific DNA recombinase
MAVKRAAIYMRVSTTDQHPEIQEGEVLEYVKRRGWSVFKKYCDKGVSGAVERRPALDALLADCRHKKIDVVVVWKFDRFARSLKQLLNALELFRTLGISFVSCTESIDTSLPHGEMLFQIIGAIAQWERSLIAERVKAGLQHARNNGKRLGRPPLRVLNPGRDRQSQKRASSNQGDIQSDFSEVWLFCIHGLFTLQEVIDFKTTHF